MFVTRKTYDAVVRERDEALALVKKLRVDLDDRAERHRVTEVDACNQAAERSRLETRLTRTIASLRRADQEVRECHAALSSTYVRDARGRIARHPLNTGGKVKA